MSPVALDRHIPLEAALAAVPLSVVPEEKILFINQ